MSWGALPHHSGRHELRRARPQRLPRSRIALFAGAAALAVLSGAAGAVSAVELHPVLDPSNEAPALNQAPADPSAATIEQAAAKAAPSVVKLETAAGPQAVEGSGVVLSADGLILTNNHVVSTAGSRGAAPASATLATFADGRAAPFTVVGADATTDVAVVRVQGISGLRPITMGSSAGLHVGQKVVAIGSPLGLDGTVTTGVISALHRPLSALIGPGGSALFDAIQTDATMSPGSSGGALVDTGGALIGLNSAIATTGAASPGAQAGWIGVGFAIPVDQARRVADQLIANAAVTSASLGHR
jgi:putative serine protease PepD